MHIHAFGKVAQEQQQDEGQTDGMATLSAQTIYGTPSRKSWEHLQRCTHHTHTHYWWWTGKTNRSVYRGEEMGFQFWLEKTNARQRMEVPEHRSNILKSSPPPPFPPRNLLPILGTQKNEHSWLSERSEEESSDEATQRGTELYQKQCG